MPGAIDYDALATQALAPAASGPSAPAGTNYDDLAGQVLDMQAKADTARATQNLVAAQGSNPDNEAKALQASKTLGIPQPAASAALPQAQQSADLQKNVAQLNAAPGLSAFIGSNPIAARLAQDDFDKLGTLDRLTTALKTGATTAIDSNALGRLGNTKQIGDLAGVQTPQTDQAIDTLEGRIAATPKLTGAMGTVQGFAGFIAGLVDNAVTGGTAGAVGGAAVGGGVGALAGGVGAVPGAVAGAGTGAVVGFNVDMASVAAGNAYIKMGQMRGSDGQPLSEAGKQFGAIFTGAATYALGSYGGAVESKLLGGGAEKIAQQAIEQAVQTPTFARAAASFAGSAAKGAAGGAAFMTAMEASNVVGEEIAKSLSGGHFETDPSEIISRLSDAAINGALTLGALHASMGGLGLYGDFREAQRAQGQVAMFKNIMDGAADSKLRSRDLDTFQQFMQSQTDGSPVENLYVPAAKIRELYQSAAVDPTKGADPIFGFVPDMAKQLADAEETGGDVVIPTADFVTHLAGSPIADQLLPDIRVGQDAMSLNQAKEYGDEYTQRVKQAADDVAGTSKDPDSAQQIADDVRLKVASTGRPGSEAAAYGSLYASRYTARAERRGLGEDPLSLYKAEGPKFADDGAITLKDGRVLNQGSTSTPEFKEWFSDSKVVSEQGSPLTAYHGTSESFSEFDSAFTGSSTGHSSAAAGHFFSVDSNIATAFAGEKWTGWPLRRGFSEGANVMPVYLSIKNPIELAAKDFQRRFVRDKEDVATFVASARKQGHDGMLIRGDKSLAEQMGGEEFGADAWIAFRPEQIKSAIGNAGKFDPKSSNILHQGERGKINFHDSTAVISLFSGADSSTLIHESGHAWLEELASDAAGEAAPQQLRDDDTAVRKWLGNDGSEFTTDQHEQFARAAEAYLMEGKAPSAALARVFSRFKQWLTKIYRTVASLDTPINDDIRGVFDRLLATDAELAEATKSSGLEPNFKDRAEAGMSEAEWNAYTAAIEKTNQQAEAAMLDKMMASVRNQRTKEYRAEYQRMAEDVAKTVDARPDMRALKLLRNGRMPDGTEVRVRLNTDLMRETYGKDGFEALPKGITSKEGVSPDQVVEMLGGFGSGDEMVRALQSLEGQQREIRKTEGEGRGIRQYLIEQETDSRMTERKGELNDEASTKDEAQAALHGEGRIELLATEMRYLRRRVAQEVKVRGAAVEAGREHTEKVAGNLRQKADDAKAAGKEEADALKQKLGDEKMTARWNAAEENTNRAALREAVAVTRPMLEALRQRVDEILAAKTTDEIHSFNRYLRDERKAAREVQEAILSKDWKAAAEAKQRQMISHMLYRSARDASFEIDQGVKTFKRMTTLRTFKTISGKYVDQIHDLLGRFGFDSRRGDELQRTKAMSLEKFVDSRFEDHGIELAVDPALYTMADKSVPDMTLAEFRMLREAVDSMKEIGEGEKIIVVDGQKLNFDDVRDEMVAAIRDLGERQKSDFYDPKDAGALAAAREKLFAGLRGIDASLTKPEALFDQIDKGDPLGIMNRSVFRRLKDAQHREDEWQQAASESLKEAVDAAGKGWSKHLDDAVPDDLNLVNPETGRPMRLTRQRMLSMALNWGNEGNRQKLADGYKWDTRVVKAFLDRNMTKADWNFVQDVWGIFDKQRPELDALQKRVTGVGLDLVKSDSFLTPHGEYAGGYFPVVYDPARSFASEAHVEKANTEALFQNGFQRATTPKGSTIARLEGVKRPIQLSLNVTPRKIGQVIHDIAFREAIIDADRLLDDGSVKRAFDEVFGSEYRKTLRPWLQHIANSRNVDDAAIGWIDKAIQTARTNTVMVGIGFRLSTILKHDLTALANSIGEIGGKEMLKATTDLYRPGGAGDNSWKFIFDKSAEMRYRQNAYDKDISAAHDKLIADSRYTAFQKAAQHYGHLAVSKLDMGTAGPVWLSAYRKATAEGRGDTDAVYVADKTVRNAHGSQGITDTAAIQRAKGAAQLINMFYGFFNHVYNRQRLIGIDAASGIKNLKAGEGKAATKDFASVLARSFWYVAVPGLIEAIVATQGPNQNKDESWGGWAAKAVLGSVPSGIPILRDIARAAIEGRDYEGSPIVNAVNSVMRGGTELYQHVVNDKDLTPDSGKHFATAAGLLTGLPTAAPFTAGKFLWDYGTGEADPQSIAQWYQGLTTGKVSE